MTPPSGISQLPIPGLMVCEVASGYPINRRKWINSNWWRTLQVFRLFHILKSICLHSSQKHPSIWSQAKKTPPDLHVKKHVQWSLWQAQVQNMVNSPSKWHFCLWFSWNPKYFLYAIPSHSCYLHFRRNFQERILFLQSPSTCIISSSASDAVIMTFCLPWNFSLTIFRKEITFSFSTSGTHGNNLNQSTGWIMFGQPNRTMYWTESATVIGHGKISLLLPPLLTSLQERVMNTTSIIRNIKWVTLMILSINLLSKNISEILCVLQVIQTHKKFVPNMIE